MFPSAGKRSEEAGVQACSLGRRRYGRTLDSMSGKRLGYKTARFHLLDVFPEDRCGFRSPTFRQSHGLPDDHESPGQQPQPRESLSAGLKLLFYACSNIDVLFDKDLHNGRRGRRSDDLTMVQFPGKEKVIGAASAHDNPMPRAVHILVGLNVRVLPDQEATFDQHIGSGECDALSTGWVNGKKAYVRFFPGDGLYGFAGGINQDEFDSRAEPFREIIGKVDGYPDRGTASRIPLGKDRIAEVDRGAQYAGRCEFTDNS